MGHDLRAIVLEDDPDISRLIEKVVSDEGFDVRLASTIEECRRAMQWFDAAIFIVDIGLPDGSGLSMVREIRARGRAGILILSGRADEVDKVLGLEFGADDYVTKPFRPRELIARLRALYRRVASMPATEPSAPAMARSIPDFEIAGYRLFLEARRVVDEDGRDVTLTAAEFDVLNALLELGGTIATRDQIIGAARRRNWSANDRTIDGIVSRLRRKLPVPGSQPHFIRTMYGAGYMLTT